MDRYDHPRNVGRRQMVELGVCAALLGFASDAIASVSDAAGAASTGAISDFDFQVGRWSVRHHARSAASGEWNDFSGEVSMRKILGGSGNLEEHHWTRGRQSYHAVGLRAFDPERRQWAIYWLDSRWPGAMGSPVVGGFEGAQGTFYSDDDVNGRPVRARYLWMVDGADACRWEQATSDDGGKSWDTSWRMAFARLA